MKLLRIGVVGAGAIMRERHLPGLQAIPGVSIVAVCNSTPESSAAFIQEFGLDARVEPKWQNLCGADDIDIIWIAGPPYIHSPIACAALCYGKHVFCQARMAMNTAETKGMLAATLGNPHLVASLCPAPYGIKKGRFVKNVVKEGHLGQLLNMRMHSLSDLFADPNAPAHWRQKADINGCNFLTVGIFAEIMMHWLGPIHRLRGFTKIFYADRGGEEITMPDYAAAHVEWPDGLVGSMDWSGVCPGPPRHRFELYGSQGALIYDFNTDNIWVSQGNTGDFVPAQVPPEMLAEWTVEADFIAAVRGEAPHPRPDFYEGSRYIAFTEGLLESSESGEWVEMDWPEFGILA